ncbi:N-acyl homoserine lactonase family protein [Pseudonocardia yuanmonensis]|uniref:N-acyl homoserine lactonase family protein n=1 Tax=Pseudonocardia yuanmonensis TaxID=1095914 RepID=A0ABP8XKX5_9PSEU
MNGATYEVFAVRYGHMDRRASENFLGGCACDGPMPIDYYVWVVRSADRTVVVDTGFGPAEGVRRGRSVLNSVGTGLAALGVEPAHVDDVVLTHLHYDHAGNLGLFPRARFHVQERELQFVVGRHMADPTTASAYCVEEIVDAVHLVHAGRVRFSAEDEELFPGLSVHLVGGHTGGTQVVRVRTARGPLLLASDALHFYANHEKRHVFAVTHDPDGLLEVYDRRFPELVDDPDDVVPGHDPLVLTRYPAARTGLEGYVALLSDGRTTTP